MPFFPRFHYPQHSVASVYPTDLFRLFDQALEEATSNTSQASSRAFSPNFDVHETEHEYVLEGELPGLDDKNKLSIEFTDDQTLLIRGKIERSVKRQSDDQGKITAVEEGKEKEEKKEEKKEVAVKEGEQGKQVGQSAQGTKWWVSERTVGEFSRSFSFPGTIDIDAVKASLEHGILKIVVPKKEKPAGRRITVN